ncbi:MAG TPA: alpha-amylase family glycosyl hydrolase [Flavisolibacter sp.]|nr:alpha-amylase family glycosyl hydrolase [Flavisolibacter sp.]
MKRFSIFILSIIFLSCSKSDRPASNGLPTDPAQFGTPYENLPAGKDATIYQVNIRAFSPEGNLQGVTAKLDHIKSLGVNVIYLMPIYPVGAVRSVNSPYAVRDYKAVGEEFGTLEDLRTLVSTAHQKDMAVILDFVANHTAWDHPWITSNKSWYRQDANGNIVSPAGFNDVAQLNFDNDSLRTAVIEALRYWVFAANVDGYRFDFADNVPVAFWKEAITSLRGIEGHQLLLFAEGTRNDHFRTGFDLTFGFSFYGNLKDVYQNGKTATQINEVNKTEYTNAYDASRVVRYISNHDINLSDGTPKELFGGEKGALAAFVIASYMKGVPMIYNGQEIGYNNRINYFKRDPINWTANSAVTEEYKKILGFRNSSLPIREGQLYTYSSDDVVAFSKEQGDEKVFTMVNVRNKTVDYTLPASLANTTWKEAYANGNVTLQAKVTLQPYQYIVLKNQ